ncbi:MAG: TauD/TfdA family dioxygenase [Alphaproteobacteria bacterium]|nr:TauD/TfdA family dioxygenase [Alphaproteobacteria bacterium]
MTNLKITAAAGPIGAEITGADVSRPLDTEIFQAIDGAIDDYAVIVIRDQNLTAPQLADFSRRFGRPQVNVRQTANNDGTPEVGWISNVTKDGKQVGSHDAGRYWHSDLCYLERPSKLTVLNALEVPTKDGVTYGVTQFAGTVPAYDALTDEMKHRLEGVQGANSYRTMWNRKAIEFGVRPYLNEAELAKYPEDAIHPVVRIHPKTGRKCLFVCNGYTNALIGLTKEESEEILEFLFDHITGSDFKYEHQWRVGDVLIWDNCAVQHKAKFDYALPLRRLMQRCTIEGDKPY